MDGRIQTLSYRSGRVSPFGIGDENLHFRVLRPKGNPPQPFDWALELSSVYPRAAEVAASVGRLRPEAPESGYVHELAFKMPASDPNWSSQMIRRFYTCNNDGGVYAGVEMQVQLPTNDGDATVTIHYAADFGKSRDLLPGALKQAGN